MMSSDTLLFSKKTIDKRQNLIKWSTIGTYSLGSIALYNIWYRQFDQSEFHTFNDWQEWENVDKMGHIQASYFQSALMFKGLKWAQLSDKDAVLWSSIAGLSFQTTIEIMDGFSKEWGFSIFDFTANIVGVSSFALQQKYWGKQKFTFKVSYWPQNYSQDLFMNNDNSDQTSLNQRANTLFGQSAVSKFIKDYNGQTIWVSFNPNSILHIDKWPDWLNISLGYGANNMYGGFNNSWHSESGHFSLDELIYPRYKQYVLALDYNLSGIKTKSRFLKTVFDVLDIFKWPAPAIELTSKGELHFHLIFRS